MNQYSKKFAWATDLAQRTYANLCAQKSKRKIIVFESDDWGGMRMPNPGTLSALRLAGLQIDNVSFNRLDGLESKQDLDLLLNVLSDHRDCRGRPPKFTCNMVLGNPDFDAIEQHDYSCFVHEPMYESYKRYHSDDLEPTWKSAISSGLVQPQFHCREHINIQLWIRDLQAAQPETRLCFKHRFFGQRTKTSSSVQKHYLAAYSAESLKELNTINQIAIDGMDLFESMFGFRSQTFVACNYVWPQELEETLGAGGVKSIQTRIKHTMPVLENGGNRVHIRRYSGQKNRLGQRYSVRNVLFEPYHNQAENAVHRALNEIQQAFFFRAAAIVSSHRVNYTSKMDMEHRDRNLRSLNELLSRISHRWPDVEFLSSDELASQLWP